MALAVPQPRVLADAVPAAWVRNIVLVVGAVAFVSICSQITFYLPWNPIVPITLQTFAVVLSAGALGTWRAGTAITLYAILGSLGAPIFMEGLSGFGGPAYGYIFGFIIAAFIVGRIAETGATKRFWRNLGLMVVGNLVIYVVGTAWLKYSLQVPWFGPESAWAYGVQDFIVGDVLKILAAAGLLPLAWAGLRKLRLLPPN